jgi:Clostripain family/Bacterial pre-peptidase C-terminal domain
MISDINNQTQNSYGFDPNQGLPWHKPTDLEAPLLGTKPPFSMLGGSTLDELPSIQIISPVSIITNVIDLAKNQLKQLAHSNNLEDILITAFGNNYDRDKAGEILNKFGAGDFSELPKIDIITGLPLNTNGAYDNQNNIIYLSQEFLNSHSESEIVGVVLEEIGHNIDFKINRQDAAGDEGDIFSRLARGQSISGEELLRLKAENDHAVIWIDGQQIAIEKNDTLGTAYNMGTLVGTRSFSDWVGSTDTNDYYKFSIDSPSNLNLSLTGLTADADVQLLNSTGTVITSSASAGTTSETIATQLSTGNYYVRVYPYSGNSNYNLSLSATPIDNAGNTLSTARNIGTLTTNQTFSDWVGSTDTNDYYKFSIGSPSNLNLSLTGLTADADVQLLNSTGTVITSSTAAASASESIISQLNTGTYYVRVYPYSGSTNYNLSLSATAVPDLAGNTLTTARAITVGTTPTTFSDWVGSSDTNDYYKFTLVQTSNFNVSLNGLTSDADIQLLNSTGTVISSSLSSGVTEDTITQQLVAGTYYVRVYPYSGNTNYNLNVSATPVITDNAGNTLSTARSITIGATTTNFSDWVGTTDSHDYYRFTLGQTSNFNLTLGGLTADADVQLLNNVGTILVSSSNWGTTDDTIAQQLSAGTYYIHVYPYSSNSTGYNLGVSALNVGIADQAGNTLGTARSISVGTNTTTYTDWLGSADTNDYYRFTLSQNSNFSLSLSGLTADADVQLLDNSGVLITSSALSGTTSETITRQLNAGNYYIRVYPYSPSTLGTNYNLGVAATSISSSATADWTVLVYMAGDNLESFGIEDFLEMAEVGSNSNINIVAQFDRTSGYSSEYGNWTDTRRGLIVNGNTPSNTWGTSIGEVNMGAESTLRDFLSWGTTTYRANNYAVILWGHGSGNQVCFDDINNEGLTSTEVENALAAVSGVSLVASDACLMGMTEFAYQLRNRASVFVGSQELIPGPGYNYTTALASLRSNPSMTALQFGNTLVDSYGQNYTINNVSNTQETLSAINLLSMNGLASALDQFANSFMSISTSNDRTKLESYRQLAGTFGDGYYPTYRDLGSLFSKLANDTTITSSLRTAAQSVLTAYNSAINRNYTEISGRGTGLSINLQQRGNSAPSSYNAYNPNFTANTRWDEFLQWWTTA